MLAAGARNHSVIRGALGVRARGAGRVGPLVGRSRAPWGPDATGADWAATRGLASGRPGDKGDGKESGDGKGDSGADEQRQGAETQSGGGGLFGGLRSALGEEMKKNPELSKAWDDVFGSRPSGGAEQAGKEGGEGEEGSRRDKGASWDDAQSRLREASEKAAGFTSQAREKLGSTFERVNERTGGAREKAAGKWGSLRERVSGLAGSVRERGAEASQRAAEAAKKAREAAERSDFAQEGREAARQAASELDQSTGLLSRVRGALRGVQQRMEAEQTVDKWRDAARELFATADDRVRDRKQRREQRRVDMQWQEYVDDATGYLYYHNHLLDETQWEAPPCWEEVARIRATIANRNAWNEAQKEDAGREAGEGEGEAGAGGGGGGAATGGVAYDGSTSLQVVDQPRTAWQRLSERLTRTPLIREILGASEEAREALGRSAVGRGAETARRRLKDRAEDLRESWETSQNPWVYTMSTVMDNVFAETEMASCLRETQRLDPQFDLYEFQREVQVSMIPETVHAYVQQETHRLRDLCSEGAYAQIRAALHELKAAGLKMDPTILDIKEAEMIAAKVIDGDPTFVFTCLVNQINCVRDQSGAVVQGAEDDVRAVFYVFAVQREYNEENAELEWKLVEFGAQGSMETW